MHEIRLVGRGGQGVVTAGDLLGRVALGAGRQAQSIPTFGPERRGALAQATVRIDDEPILLKCTTAQPDALLVLDPTVWHFANVLLGIRAGAKLVFNSKDSPEQIDGELRQGRYGFLPPHGDFEVFVVDATGIALETLGRPITNTAMIGAFVGATGLLEMDNVRAVLRERFGAGGEANVQAAEAARDGLRGVGS